MHHPEQKKAQKVHDKALTTNKGHKMANMHNTAIKDMMTNSHILFDAIHANPPSSITSSSKGLPLAYPTPPVASLSKVHPLIASLNEVPNNCSATELQQSTQGICPLGRVLGKVPPMLTDNKPKSFQSWADEMDYLLPFNEVDNKADEGQLCREIDNIASHFDMSLK